MIDATSAFSIKYDPDLKSHGLPALSYRPQTSLSKHIEWSNEI